VASSVGVGWSSWLGLSHFVAGILGKGQTSNAAWKNIKKRQHFWENPKQSKTYALSVSNLV
jgi:hypothetical protein